MVRFPPPKINMSPEQGAFLKETLVFYIVPSFLEGETVSFQGKAMPLKLSLVLWGPKIPERRSPSIVRKDSLSEEQREKDRIAVTWRCEESFSTASVAAIISYAKF